MFMDIALVPAYNEEKNIREVIARIKKVRLKPVVVDDCSRDNTYQLAKKSGAVVLRHTVNKGKAEAVKTGLNYVLKKYRKAERIVLIDADIQYLPEEAVNLLKPLENEEADFVTGYRDWSTVPFRHRLGNFAWRTLFNLIFNTWFRDTNCGFVAMNRRTAEMMKNIIYGGYILENAMFITALKNKLRIKQVPVAVLYKKTSEIPRGIRMVLGVLIFIFIEGIKYRLKLK